MGHHRVSFFRTVSLLTLITLSTKLLGLLRSILFAEAHGTTPEAIAFEAANRLPSLLFDLLLGSLIAIAFIPLFTKLAAQKGKAEAFQFANEYITFILCLAFLLTLLGECLASPLLSFLAPELTADIHAEALVLSRIQLPMLLFASLAYAFVGVQQALGSYYLPAAISLFSGLLFLLYLLFFDSMFGVIGMAVITLFSWMLQCFIQLPKLKNLSFSFRFCLPKKDRFVTTIKVFLPVLIASAVQPLCLLINTRQASAIEAGRAITAFSYADKLYLTIAGILVFSVTNYLFPKLSQNDALGDRPSSERLLSQTWRWLSALTLPIVAFTFFFSEPIISVLFERGAFNESDRTLTADALRILILSVIPFVLNEIVSKSLIANKKLLAPMISALLGLLTDLLLASSLADSLGIKGIALAILFASLVTAISNLVYSLFKNELRISLSQCLFSIGTALASVLSALILRWLFPLSGNVSFLPLFGTGLLFCLLTGILLLPLLLYRRKKT